MVLAVENLQTQYQLLPLTDPVCQSHALLFVELLRWNTESTSLGTSSSYMAFGVRNVSLARR